jgi:hypothetical protein
MNVRIEDGRLGKLGAELLLPGRDQHLGAHERVVHIEESIRAGEVYETAPGEALREQA